MIEGHGNIMDMIGKVDAICITTNLYVKSNGEAVMGRGIAKQMADQYPILPILVGFYNRRLTLPDKISILMSDQDTAFYPFPVKKESEPFNGSNAVSHMAHRFNIGAIVPGWALKADLNLITESAKILEQKTQRMKSIVIPRPGCGAGELDWSIVKPELDKILDDRFIAFTYRS